MAKIVIYRYGNSTPPEKEVYIRFRLNDGRKVIMYYKSSIKTSNSELDKFDADGAPKKRANYNRQLHNSIGKIFSDIEKAYSWMLAKGIELTSENLSKAIDANLAATPTQIGLKEGFAAYISNGSFSEARKVTLNIVARSMERFLDYNGLSYVAVAEVTPDHLRGLRDFFINECDFAPSIGAEAYPRGRMPQKPRSINTASMWLKALQAYFCMLEDSDVITKSPFRKLGREGRKKMFKAQYTSPFSLTLEELKSIRDAELSPRMDNIRRLFLLQCNLGCRISDFNSLDEDSIEVSAEGIPYIHYIPQKTRHAVTTIAEVKTPLLPSSLKSINDYGFPRQMSAQKFNDYIKIMLHDCGITRQVEIYDEASGQMQRRPLWEVASTKLARKTQITLMARVQINTTISGLHRDGSEAVKHYLALSLADLHNLMCLAFGEQK